jgi:YD repeat-containing protein
MRQPPARTGLRPRLRWNKRCHDHNPFTYDDNSRRTAILRPNGVTSGYAYDAASQVTGITHTGPSSTLMSFAYTYDAAGNRTSVTKDGGNAESYTLDSLNRLTGVTYADATTQAYT